MMAKARRVEAIDLDVVKPVQKTGFPYLYMREALSRGAKRLYLSTVNSQQSTVNSQQSTVNSQQSTVNSQQSTVNSQQSTVNSA